MNVATIPSLRAAVLCSDFCDIKDKINTSRSSESTINIRATLRSQSINQSITSHTFVITSAFNVLYCSVVEFRRSKVKYRLIIMSHALK